MYTALIFVSIKTVGILNAKAQIEPAVAFPIPGNVANTAGSAGKIPPYSWVTLYAVCCKNFARRLYPSPCHAINTSRNGACASA
jgi:hypothetical protein